MSSLRRIVSSRANGARSRGPSTQLGKLRSAANSRTHGLLAKCLVLENESSECFQALIDDYLNRFKPTDGVELDIVEDMAAASWRARRALAIETKILDTAIAAQPAGPGGDERYRLSSGFEAAVNDPAFALIQRYESRLRRMFHRSLGDFVLLRMASAEWDPEDDDTAPPTVDVAQVPNEP